MHLELLLSERNIDHDEVKDAIGTSAVLGKYKVMQHTQKQLCYLAQLPRLIGVSYKSDFKGE